MVGRPGLAVSSGDDVRRALEECDTAAMRRLWARAMPHLPQPQTEFDTQATLHLARTAAESVRFRLRAWSHRWLLDHGLPSQLPDELKPRAEQLCPVVKTSV